MHFTIGHNQKPSPTPVFPRTDGEKWTQRHARLHGNTANKTARISADSAKYWDLFFIYFTPKKFPSWFRARGGNISNKHKAKSKKIYEGIKKKSGISTEQQTWPQPALFSECWLFCPLKIQTGFLRPILISDRKGWGLSEGCIIICFAWSTSLPLTAPFLFSMLTLLLPIISDSSWVLSFPSTVYIPAYLSAPHTAHHCSRSRLYKVLKQNERQPSCSPSTRKEK